MAIVTKRSVMTLYSQGGEIYCHQVRLALAEKGVNVDIIEVGTGRKPEDLLQLNPYQSAPTLIDRELVLFEARIIMEYLDERFPHPPLLPVYPVARARSRLMMYRIERDWYTLMDTITASDKKKAEQARKELREGLLTLAPVFAGTPFFLSEEFSLVDCFLAPLLWRLPVLGIDLGHGKAAKEVQQYMTRVFEREAFQLSLSKQERDMRPSKA